MTQLTFDGGREGSHQKVILMPNRTKRKSAAPARIHRSIRAATASINRYSTSHPI
nr:hypothetical protein JVH1_9241 [Rhodococcus sp. JVH1]